MGDLETSQEAETSKRCSQCKAYKPTTDFARHRGQKDGFQCRCKECSKLDWERPDSSWRSKRIQTQYGITAEQYNEMLADQEGVCAVCAEPCKSGQRLSIDHDHVSGLVRGLCCRSCNNGLGRFRDNKDFLVKAAIYIHRHQRRAKDTLTGS